ncbi:MAG: acyl-CoA dehydrogenase family protein [Nocardioidaceae bacterium]
MSDAREMLVRSATDLLRDLCSPEEVRGAETSGLPTPLWAALTEVGFPLVGVPEETGGSGGDLADVCALLEVAGRFAAPVPLAETGMLGGWALGRAGLPLPAGPCTVAPGRPGDEVTLAGGPGGWHLRCRVTRVPWAADSEAVVLLASAGERLHVLSLPQDSFRVHAGRNVAGEPRDTVTADCDLPDEAVAPAPAGVDGESLARRGALSRAALMSGAMQRVSALAQRYTEERHQFGRPIARFQAVQHHLVRIAEQAAATHTAVTTAALNASALPEGARPDLFDVAAAKIVAGDAATVVTAAAHQAHGAIGMTREYELAQHTRRLWSWRDEYGTETQWSREIGRVLTDAGADALWPRISTGRVA